LARHVQAIRHSRASVTAASLPTTTQRRRDMKTFVGKWLLIPALLLVAGVACSSSPAASPTTYKAPTTAGGTVGIGLSQWAATPTAATISAGSVTFNVTN